MLTAMSCALALSLLANVLALKLWREDARRRSLRGDVAKNFEYWAKNADLSHELRASCDLAMAEVVKGSIRARTVEGMAYREGAFDALTLLKRALDPKRQGK